MSLSTGQRLAVPLVLGSVILLLSPTAQAQGDLPVSLSVTSSPDPVAPGGQVLGRIHLANPSTTTATGPFRVTADVAQHMTANPASPGGCSSLTCRAGTVMAWNVPSLPPGESTVLMYTGTIDNSATNPPPAAGTVLTTAVTATVGSIATTASSSVVVGARPISLAVTGAPNRVAPGGALTYTLSFGNATAAPLAGKLRLPLPAGTSFQSASGGGVETAGVVEWDLGTMAAGFADRRQLTVTVGAGAVPGSLLTASAEARDATGAQVVASAFDVSLVATQQLLAITLVASPDPVAPGAALVYRLMVANGSTNTPTPAFPIVATVPQHVDVSPEGAGGCTSLRCRHGEYVRWNMPALAPGQIAVRHFTARVDNSVMFPPPPDGTVLVSQATAYVFGGVTAQSVVVVNSGAGLELHAGASPSEVLPGSAASYTFTFGNAGKTATAARLRVPLPSGTTFVSATGGGTMAAGAVEWDLGMLAPGFSDRRQLTVMLPAGVAPGTLLVAEAELRDASSARTLVRAAKVTMAVAQRQMALSLRAEPDPAGPSGTILFRANVANLTTNTPSGAILLEATAPPHVLVATQSAGGCTSLTCRYGELLRVNVPSIGPGESQEFLFTAKVDNSATTPPPPPGSLIPMILNASGFHGGTGDTVVVVGDGANLGLSVGSSPARVAPGGTVTYSLAYGNSGAAAVAAGLRVALPPGTTFVSATGGGALDGQVVKWDLGEIAANSADRRQLTVTVGGGVPGGSLLEAEAELRETSTQRSLQRRVTTSLVGIQPLVTMSMTASLDRVMPGTAVVYKINIANLSPNTPTGAFLVQAVPPRWTVASQLVAGGCTSLTCRHGEYVRWNVPSLAPMGNTVLQFTATVDNSVANPPPPGGTVLNVVATTALFGGAQASVDTLVGGGPVGPPPGVDAGGGGGDPDAGPGGSDPDAGGGAGADGGVAPDDAGGGGAPGTGGPGTGGAGGGLTDGGLADAGTGDARSDAPAKGGDSGCSCSLSGRGSGAGWPLLAVLGVGLVVRTRRRFAARAFADRR